MKLTKHFDLREFTESATARIQGIPNVPSTAVIANLQRLCIHVLEPLRNHTGRPIIISSGYRCQALNTVVGGVATSNHLTGCAADIHLPSNDVGREWFEWIKENCQYDELIWETANHRTFWIHVALREKGNRRKVVSYLVKKSKS